MTYGNIIAYKNSNGNTVAAYSYDPFGNVISHIGMDFTYKFSTKPQDDLSGMHYYGYRFYQPTWVIPADDHLVSGVHAILNYSNGKVIIRDNNSKNGTFYQSKKIVEKVVSPGDEYLIGNCVLKINIQMHTLA